MHVVLGVTGGIAAYKAAELIREYRKSGDEVRVIMTRNAVRFISPMTLGVLAGRRVYRDLFPENETMAVDHVDLAGWADVLVVAPATANILAKFRHGIADDLLSTFYLAHHKETVVAPAMNQRMWEHTAVQDNLKALAGRDVRVVVPGEGELACGDVGPGRLAEIYRIVAESRRAGNTDSILEGRKVLVTAGPTREPVDPVRFLSNPSTGRMGYEIAREAYARGAEVTLVSGPSPLTPPHGVKFIPVSSATEMEKAVLGNASSTDILFMAAAVGDFIPASRSKTKIRREKGVVKLELRPTTDILLNARRAFPDLLIVGFAAETRIQRKNVRAKMERKGADFLIVNDVSRSDIGFASDQNEGLLLSTDGGELRLKKGSKREIARRIIDHVGKHEKLG